MRLSRPKEDKSKNMSVSESPYFLFSPLYHRFLSIITKSTRILRVNWGILESMEEQKTTFILFCDWKQFLSCSYALNKHDLQFLCEDFKPEKDLIYYGEIRKIIKNDIVSLTIQNSVNKCKEDLLKGKNILLSIQNDSKNNLVMFSEIIRLAQAHQIPFLPACLSNSSQHSFSMSNGMCFSYPFSQTAMSIGHPIEVENIPVDQSYLMLKNKLSQLEKLTRNLLQVTV